MNPRLTLSAAARYRLGVAARAVAAIAGAYLASAQAMALLAVLLPVTRVEAVMTATLLSFPVYAVAVMWVFAARSALLAWAGIASVSVILAGALWLHGSLA